MTDPTDAQILELAGRWYKGAGRAEQAMRDELDLSATQFALRLNRIVDAPSPEIAVRFAPTIRVLRDRRERGMAARTSRRAG